MEATATSIYDIPVTALDGTAATLAPYRGQVLLIVNVASKCGFTGQYKGLEELYRTHKDRGLVVLGFPCNQFMGQEPGDAEEIKQFCSLKYDVTFPMFAKLNVNGAEAHPLYKYLKSAARGFLGTQGIKWNFTKFLVDRSGHVVGRYSALTEPSKLTGDIERLLAAPA
ncbi:glutathione peroxidase [Frigoriglobus tundricola]|uniref:Glutathione peroxidase n=1 Tax=Frigoriglobus tundricola TaxID=2774151 RepID=A0A6M5YKM1_9BACT|nr:glutathione peroxidase [Frigoriglobus tundricola]QJW94124.1 Glutathione peroxidase [Frigoriglobus tundricola]